MKRAILILPLLLSLCSPAGKEFSWGGGAGKTESPAVIAGIGPAAAETEADLSPHIVSIPEEVRLGEPVTVGFVKTGDGAAGNFRAALFNRRGERLAGAAVFTLGGDAPELLAAVLAVPSTALPGEALIRVEKDGVAIGEIPLTLADREFVAEEIVLDRRNTEIRTVPDPQKTAEAKYLQGIINSTGTAIYTTGPFSPPVTSTRRTSFFGDRRVFRYATGKTDTAIHAGVDYGVPTGTEVRSCAAGKVVLARFRIATGNSVVLEHLPGVYSLYYHLDTLQVTEGMVVGSAYRLGESGATGLATGPHLHWEIRVSGENADPDAFVTRTILDKAAILSKINAERDLYRLKSGTGPIFTGREGGDLVGAYYHR
jgi:murein DD-endopeptidase MepM/ murein hydrolase activator NlpD